MAFAPADTDIANYDNELWKWRGRAKGGTVELPFCPFMTLRPSWFHAYSPATLVAFGFCHAIFEGVAKAIVMETAHRGQIWR